jgi:hypothetical protein
MINLLFQNENLRIEEDTDVPCLVITWSGYTNDKQFMTCVDKIVEITIDKRPQKTLSDMSRHKGISPTAQNYATEKSKEITRIVGEIKRALVLPKDIFGQFSVKNVNNRAVNEDHQIRRSFDNFEEAKQWLMEDELSA